MRNMSAKNTIEGLNTDNSNSDFVFEVRVYRKQKRFRFYKLGRGELQPRNLGIVQRCYHKLQVSKFYKKQKWCFTIFKKYNSNVKNKYTLNVRILKRTMEENM